MAHYVSNGCGLQPADLLGTGTIFAPARGSAAARWRLARGSEERRFLEDGD